MSTSNDAETSGGTDGTAGSSAPPKQPNANYILFWMCVLIAINQLGFGAMVPSLPLYAQSFGVAASAIGMAVGIYGLARFFVAIPAGQLSDRLGRSPTLAIGGLISGLGNLWCAWAVSYPEFMVARFVAGAGAGLLITTGHVVLADISPPERRGRMISIYMGTFIFAVGIGPFPGGLLAEHYGLEAPFIAYGTASLLAMVVAWFAVPETRHFATEGKASVGKAPPFIDQVRLIGLRIGFLLAALVVFMNAFVRTGGLFAIVPIFAATQLGLSVSQIGFAMMVGSITGLVAAYPGGWISDKFGRKAIIVPATLLSGVAMIVFCVSDSYLWFMVASIVWGIASTIGGSTPSAYAADSAPPGMNATAMSTFRMMGDGGYVLGPFALGLIVDLYGTTVSLLLAGVLMFVVGMAFAIWAPETLPKTAKSTA